MAVNPKSAFQPQMAQMSAERLSHYGQSLLHLICDLGILAKILFRLSLIFANLRHLRFIG